MGQPLTAFQHWLAHAQPGARYAVELGDNERLHKAVRWGLVYVETSAGGLLTAVRMDNWIGESVQ